MSVSRKFISEDKKFEVEARSEEERSALIKYIGRIHDIIVNCCEEYFNQVLCCNAFDLLYSFLSL